jgi:hypothetical protein
MSYRVKLLVIQTTVRSLSYLLLQLSGIELCSFISKLRLKLPLVDSLHTINSQQQQTKKLRLPLVGYTVGHLTNSENTRLGYVACNERCN